LRDGIVDNLGYLAPGGAVAWPERAVIVPGDYAVTVGCLYVVVESAGSGHVTEVRVAWCTDLPGLRQHDYFG